MSLILEALKRSEKERQRQADSVTDTLYIEVAPRRRNLWPVLLVALLLVNIGIMTFLWWRQAASDDIPATQQADPEAIIAAARKATPDPQPPAASDGPSRIAARILRPLDQELGGARVVPARRPATTQAPARKSPAAGATTAAASPPTTSEPEQEPAIGAMDDATLQSLQRYEINIIVYSDIPARRYALIDMKKLREGDTLPGSDLRIERIAQGALIIDTGHGLVSYSGTP